MQKTDPTMTKILRISYERGLIKLFKTFIKQTIPRLKPVIQQENSKLLSDISKHLAVVDFGTIIDEEIYYNVETKLPDVVDKHINQSYRRGVNKAVKEINRGTQTTLPIITPILTDLDQRAINILKENNFQLVKNLASDVKKRMLYIINDGILKGYGINIITRNIKNNTVGFSRKRCQTIARTEIIRSYNTAAINKYKQAGITMYQWVTAFDERTCEICAGLDGKTFPVDGGERPPVHPRCRCTVIPVIKKTK